MKFVFPCPAYERRAVDYIQEFWDYGSAVNGTGGLERYLKERTYAEWLGKVLYDLDVANLPPDRVPAYTYFYADDGDAAVVGMINIRLQLDDFLRREGGNIGYSVRPTQRGKGHATRMLRRALGICGGRLGMARVLISCERENLASAGVIRACGGVLEEEFFSGTFGETIQRYHIDLTAGE